MKKSIKRLLIMTQVLGLSALAATACTKNTAETKPADTAAKDTKKTDETKKEPNQKTSKETTSITLDSPVQLKKDEQDKVRTELTKELFNNDNLGKMANGTYTSNDNNIKGLLDQFPVKIENDEGNTTMPNKEISDFLKEYESAIIEGNGPNNEKIAQASAIDPSKKSIDGVNGPLDPEQSAPSATKSAAKK